MALSSALYLVAEWAEEFPTLAGKVVKGCLVGALCLHLLLWFDGMPWYESLVGIGCNLVYASMFSSYPFIEVLSVRSVSSMLAFLFSHYVWFSYFLDNTSDILHVVGFFVVMVWLVPGGLFVSVTVSDATLPGTHGKPAKTPGSTNLFKGLYDLVVPYASAAHNLAMAKIAKAGTRLSGGGAYGSQKKKDDYGGGGGYAGGGYGSGSSISVNGQAGQYQYPSQYQQHQQQYQQQPPYQQQPQYQQHQQQYQQPGSYSSGYQSASSAMSGGGELKRR